MAQPVYYDGRAGAHAAQDKLTDTVADLDAALALDPNASRFLMLRALADRKLGQALAGLPDAQKAVRLAPEDWQAFDVLGQVCFATGKYAEATDALTASLKLRPKGEEEEAMSKPGAPAYPTLFERLDLWDDFARFTGRHRNTMDSVAPMLKQVVFDPEVLYFRGKSLFHLGRWKAAREDLGAALRYFDDRKPELTSLISTCNQKVASGA